MFLPFLILTSLFNLNLIIQGTYLYRGVAKALLNRKLEAKQDFETALKLVDVADDKKLKATIEKALEPFGKSKLIAIDYLICL